MRLFVALEVPEDLRSVVAERADALSERLPRARWVPRRNLHLTLVFLGETDPARLPTLSAALAEAFSGSPAMTLRLAGGGTFPPRRPARVVWIGFEPSQKLAVLQRRVAAAACTALGLEPERRPFHAHLTLARCRRPWPRAAAELWARSFEGPQGAAFAVDEGLLVRSHLSPQGARYETVRSFPLGGAGAAGM